MATANRTRESGFKNDPGALFRNDQSLGRWWRDVIDEIVEKGRRVVVSDLDGSDLEIQRKRDWEAFEREYLRGQADETDRQRAERLRETLGITLTSFVCFLDDICVSAINETVFDARRNSALADVTHLYGQDGEYARWTDAWASYADEAPSAPIAADAEETMTLSLIPAIDPEIMAATNREIFGRDRQEVESQFDFEPSREGRNLFREHTGTDLWEPLDLDDLETIDWSDAARVGRILEFAAPVHPEKRADGSYIDRNEPFLEVYMDTSEGLLERNSLSLRARMRPEQDRGLIQMKIEKEPNNVTGHPVREKWERRFRGPTFFGDVLPNLTQMIRCSQFGYAFGAGMPELKKLYDILRNKNAIDEGQKLVVRPDHIIFQRRRRSRLRLDSLETLRSRAEKLEALNNEPDPHANLQRVLSHVRIQVAMYTAAQEAISTYIPDRMLGGEAVILSADRWSVFEPGAWPANLWPERLGAAGRRGRGLRFETELDTSTSEVFADALEELERRRVDGGDTPELNRHQEAIEVWRREIWRDVAHAARLMASHLESHGVVILTDTPPSKSLQASSMIAEGQGGFRRGHRFWI